MVHDNGRAYSKQSVLTGACLRAPSYLGVQGRSPRKLTDFYADFKAKRVAVERASGE